ncbi:DUF898 family protein [Cognatishimia activa]|uniref:Putative membrane protein n=1 Tax=Cognatishimia activa TaxID=1715691 RepID=A0A0N7MC75_9RHOB|nr:DUF898 family protein [Cognatishimia activa]CUI47922.1 putative membrane protein [Cognatishimia activa]CUK27424.1 putative membrane protein [Cognatishimia activa]
MQVISPWEAARSGEPETEVPTQTEFAGRRARLFWLALRMGLLTVLTLGFYRFWMKTRLRRWYWSAWRPSGHPLEYVGDPWEKLLGFLIAVVFLAFYIGIVNLLLMFLSFSLFNGNFAAYLLSFLGVIPLWFYARYRARRYVLARTRWRGVRFGLEPGAWGFAVRALWHWFLTIITLGVLWPRKAFYLEKYITDRTYFGAQKLTQNGSWFGLLRPWVGVWLPVLASGFAFGVLGYEGYQAMQNFDWVLEDNPTPPETSALWQALVLAAPIVAFIAPIWLLLALVNYNVKRVRYLTSHKSAGDASLDIKPRFWKVTGIYFWGYSFAGLVGALILTPIIVIMVLVFESDGMAAMGLESGTVETLPQPVLTAIAIASYFLLFLMWSVLMHTFIRFPMMRHFASSLTIINLGELANVSQRPRDEFGEAEGFAEALDVGAAI